MGFRIKEIYVFSGVDDDDDECILISKINGRETVFIAGNKERFDALKPHAQLAADKLGQELAVFKMTLREEIDTIKPRAKENGE